jgi:hypothetical protein
MDIYDQEYKYKVNAVVIPTHSIKSLKKCEIVIH